MHNFRTKDQNEKKVAKFRVDNYAWQGWNW